MRGRLTGFSVALALVIFSGIVLTAKTCRIGNTGPTATTEPAGDNPAVASAAVRGSSVNTNEPSGGLVEIALNAAEFDGRATRVIRLLIDPEARPSTYLFDVPGTKHFPSGPGRPHTLPEPDPMEPFRERMDAMGADAVVYLAYDVVGQPSIYVKILRFPKVDDAEREWSIRQNLAELQVVKISGAEVLVSKPGQLLRENLKAGFPTIQGREGRYWIRVGFALPELNDPGFKYLLKQLEKIKDREAKRVASLRQSPLLFDSPLSDKLSS